MNESVIIQKLIQVGQMLERGELEYSGAEADTKYYLDRYAALLQPTVVCRIEQLVCEHPDEALIRDKPTEYCMACGMNI